MSLTSQPLISVIIPCFNHAKYLPEAVESVQQQSYKNVEIIVVDDGSVDDTKAVAQQLDGVIYVYQSNQGLSAARNTGFRKSKGDYLVFLDADDYLYPTALETNLTHLVDDTKLAFVSGFHDKVDEWRYLIEQDEQVVVQDNHYKHLLQGNYIGMHATVMYTRWAIEEFQFDTTLKACEDYDLYFRITRKYPVANHDHKIAAYRIHGSNMSGNIPFMLKMVLQVQGKQRSMLANNEEKEAFTNGIQIWKRYYINRLYSILNRRLYKEKILPTPKEQSDLFSLSTKLGIKLWMSATKRRLKNSIKKSFPEFLLRRLYRRGMYPHYVPRPHHVQWGDLERTTPFSNDFGYDRGGPVDRYYIEKFLTDNTEYIKGRAFEIGDNAYTMQYGGKQITKSDVLHVYQANDTVTYIGDLSDAPQIPSDAFDCIILTQTLHFIYDFKAALKTCHRMLKKGGVLLLTVPGISHIDKGEWKEYWLWAFTDKSMRKVMEETFPGATVEIKTFGNVYVATSFLYGLGLPEVNKKFLDVHDPSYQVIIAVRAMK